MADSQTEMILKLKTDFAKAQKDLVKLESSVGKVGSTTKSAASGIKTGFGDMKAAVMPMAMGIMAGVGAVISLTQAAMEQQKVEMMFTKALALSGNAAAGASEKYFQLASDIQKVTTVGDEVTISMMQLALSMGATEQQLPEITKGAVGLSKSLGIDLNSAAKMVTLGMSGQYAMLSRYIPALRTAQSESERAALFQKALADGFNVASEEAKTSAGRMEQLSNNFGDLKEKLGTLLLPVLDTVTTSLSSMVGAAQSLIDSVKSLNAENALGALTSGLRSFAEYSTLGLSETVLGFIGVEKATDEAAEAQERLANAVDATSSPTKKLFRNIAMVSEELAAMQDLEKNATDTNEMMYARQQIEKLTKEMDKLTGAKKKAKKEAVAPLAGSMGDLNKKLGEQKSILENGTIPGTDAWHKQLMKIVAMEGQIRALGAAMDRALPEPRRLGEATDELQKYIDTWKSFFDWQQANDPSIVISRMASAISVDLVDTGNAAQKFSENMAIQLGSTASLFDMLAATGSEAFETMGGALAGNAEGMKGVLKSLLNTVITYTEGLILAAAAAASGKAVTSFGLSLITDAPLLASAFAGLELARGFINSFQSGIKYVPGDMFAQLHEGESVKTKEETRAERQGQRKYTGNKVHVSRFKMAIDDYYITGGAKVR
jgi:hypothetical protein